MFGAMRWLTACSLVAIGVSVFAQAPATTPIDVSKVGPRVGEQVPDFSLSDQNGTTRTLSSTLGSKGAMLVFFRSADW